MCRINYKTLFHERFNSLPIFTTSICVFWLVDNSTILGLHIHNSRFLIKNLLGGCFVFFGTTSYNNVYFMVQFVIFAHTDKKP